MQKQTPRMYENRLLNEVRRYHAAQNQSRDNWTVGTMAGATRVEPGTMYWTPIRIGIPPRTSS